MGALPKALARRGHRVMVHVLILTFLSSLAKEHSSYFAIEM